MLLISRAADRRWLGRYRDFCQPLDSMVLVMLQKYTCQWQWVENIYFFFKYVNEKKIYKSLERPCQWLIKKAFIHLNTPVVNTI